MLVCSRIVSVLASDRGWYARVCQPSFSSCGAIRGQSSVISAVLRLCVVLGRDTTGGAGASGAGACAKCRLLRALRELRSEKVFESTAVPVPESGGEGPGCGMIPLAGISCAGLSCSAGDGPSRPDDPPRLQSSRCVEDDARSRRLANQASIASSSYAISCGQRSSSGTPSVMVVSPAARVV